MKKENNNNIKETSSTVKENGTRNKIIIYLLLIFILILLMVVLIKTGYSKYTEEINGSTSAKVAKMICEIEVLPSEDNKEVINPYCIVTVKDYNNNDEITETDVEYTIEVLPKGDFKMPEYYWQDSNGIIIARSTQVNGRFVKGNKNENKYKIVFLNSGEEDITRLVEFNLIAIQGT